MRPMVPIALAALLAGCGGETPVPAPAVHEDIVSAEPAPLDPHADAAEEEALASCGPVTAEGYCGVSFGEAPDRARASFPVSLEIYGDLAAANDVSQCFEMFAAEPVQGVSFLVEMAKVGRIDVLSEGPKTIDGFGVGTPAADIRAKFGDMLLEQPNKYEREVTELVLQQGATKFVFEIQDGQVRAWRAGTLPTIDYVEHCG